MKVTDDRKITVEIDGTKHKLTLDEAQELYSELGKVAGIVRSSWDWTQWRYPGFIYTTPINISGTSKTTTAQGGYLNSGQLAIVGEGGPGRMASATGLSVADASRWITVTGDVGVSGDAIAKAISDDDPDEDDPPMAVAV